MIGLLIVLAIAFTCFFFALKESCPRRKLGYDCRGANCDAECPESLMVPPTAGKTLAPPLGAPDQPIEPLPVETKPVKPIAKPTLVKPKATKPAAVETEPVATPPLVQTETVSQKANKPNRRPKAKKPNQQLSQS